LFHPAQTMEAKIVFILVLLGLSAFFAGAEIALASLSPAKVRQLLENKKGGAKNLAWLKENPQRFIGATIIGNTVVNVAISVLATVLTIELFGNEWIGLATGVIALVVLVFGEILPKALATAYAEGLSLVGAGPLKILALFLLPLITLFDFISTLLLKILGKKKGPTITEDELRTMARMAAEEGTIEHTEREMLESLFQFNDIMAEDVMTPRVNIFALDAEKRLGDVLQKILSSPFSRIPIFTKTIDRITGIVYARDILQHLVSGKDINVPLASIARPVFFVSHTMTLNELFREFQVRKVHMAAVLDAHGGTEGLVTLEDLLEELVGEIIDETDVSPALIKRLDRNTIVVDGKTELRDIRRFFNVKFPGKDQTAIGDFILYKIGTIPKENDTFSVGGLSFVIQEADERKVGRVKIIKAT